jgi:hypothetical protein
MSFLGVARDDATLASLQMAGPIYRTTQGPVTATAGGGQASALLINSSITRVGTVATAGDSVILPAAQAGREHIVINSAANSMNVFPPVGGSINALAVNTAYAVAGGKTCTFFVADNGVWYANLSA